MAGAMNNGVVGLISDVLIFNGLANAEQQLYVLESLKALRGIT